MCVLEIFHIFAKHLSNVLSIHYNIKRYLSTSVIYRVQTQNPTYTGSNNIATARVCGGDLNIFYPPIPVQYSVIVKTASVRKQLFLSSTGTALIWLNKPMLLYIHGVIIFQGKTKKLS